MKFSRIAIFVVCVFSESCAIVDYKDAKDNVRRAEQLVKKGDNIRSARSRLIANDFHASDIFSAGSGYRFILYLTKATWLDDVSYAMGSELAPWRNGIPKFITFRSGSDEIIRSIEIKKN